MTFMSVERSPFGAGMPDLGECLGFNLTYKKCAPRTIRRGVRVGLILWGRGGFCPKLIPPSYK